VLTSLVVSIVKTCTRFAPLTVLLALIIAVGTGFYAARNFAINTDINTLISPNLDWRQRDQTFEKAFEQERMILAVVEAPSPEFARTASAKLLGPQGERIGQQALASVRGTIDGLVLVGLGFGVVMTLVYVFLGVPHPILLGAITAIAAMIPFGAPVAFGIAALLLLGQGSPGGAIAVVVIGFAAEFVAGHFVRPALIGSATRLPFFWALVGILGGVETLGLLGLFVGPATMAVLVMLWRELVEGDPTPIA